MWPSEGASPSSSPSSSSRRLLQEPQQLEEEEEEEATGTSYQPKPHVQVRLSSSYLLHFCIDGFDDALVASMMMKVINYRFKEKTLHHERLFYINMILPAFIHQRRFY